MEVRACPEWEKYLSCTHSDDLSPREQEALKAHLATCPACSQVRASYIETDNLLRSLPAIKPLPSLPAMPIQNKKGKNIENIVFPFRFRNKHHQIKGHAKQRHTLILPTASKGRKQSPGMVILLASLVFILLGITLGFYVIPNYTSFGKKGGSTPTPTRTLTRTPVLPYSPTFGFNTQHTRFIPDETTLNTSNVARLTLDWKMPTNSGIRSSPVIANGLVYITASDNTLYAFDATTGAKRWQASTGSYSGQGSFIFSSPTVVNNVLYVGSNDHHVYAFNATTGGKPLWVSPTSDSIYSSPTVVNNVLYIGSTDHNVYAFDATDGAQIWKTPTGGTIYSSPAVVNNTVYIGSDDSKLYALDASTGHVLWVGIAGGHIDSSPTVVDGMVYVGDDDGRIYAFNDTGCQGQLTCQPVWTAATGNFIASSSAVAPVGGREILYIGSHDNTLYAYDTNKCLNIPANDSCSPYWTWMAPAQNVQPFESSPTVANGLVYVGSWDGNLYIYNAQSGTLLWHYTTGGQIISSPTVLNGIVYVGSTDGYLYAFHL